jgi:hypothetical protein
VAVGTDKDCVVRRVRVAIRALRVLMREPEPSVIEGRTGPSRGRMAGLACCRKTRSDVIGIRCPLIVGLVAGVTVSRSSGKVSINVTA